MEVIQINSPQQAVDFEMRRQSLFGLDSRGMRQPNNGMPRGDNARLMQSAGIDWAPTARFLRFAAAGDKAGMRDAYKSATALNRKLFTQVLDPQDEGTAADGGYLVPTELTALVMQILRNSSTFWQHMRHISMRSNVRDVPTLGTGPTVAWYGENAAIDDTKVTFGKLTLTAKKLACIVAVSNELLEDTPVDAIQVIAENVADAIALEIDTQIARGTGTPWTGLLGLTTGTYVQGDATNSGKTKYIDVTWDDLFNMTTTKLPPNAMKGAALYIDQNVWNVLLKLKDGQNNYLYWGSTANGLPRESGGAQTHNESDNSMLWYFNGFPVHVMPSGVLIGTFDAAAHVTTKHAIFGNVYKTCWIGDKRALTADLGTEATIDGVNLYANDLTGIRYTQRLAFGCGLPLKLIALVTSTT